MLNKLLIISLLLVANSRMFGAATCPQPDASKGCGVSTKTFDCGLNLNALQAYMADYTKAGSLFGNIGDLSTDYNQALTQLSSLHYSQGVTFDQGAGEYPCSNFLTAAHMLDLPAECETIIKNLSDKAVALSEKQTELIDFLNTKNCINLTSAGLAKKQIVLGDQSYELYDKYPLCAIRQALWKMENTINSWRTACNTQLQQAQEAQTKKQMDAQMASQETLQQQSFAKQDQMSANQQKFAEDQANKGLIASGVSSGVMGVFFLIQTVPVIKSLILGEGKSLENIAAEIAKAAKISPEAFVRSISKLNKDFATGLEKSFNVEGLTGIKDIGTTLAKFEKQNISAEDIASAFKADETAGVAAGEEGSAVGNLEKVAGLEGDEMKAVTEMGEHIIV